LELRLRLGLAAAFYPIASPQVRSPHFTRGHVYNLIRGAIINKVNEYQMYTYQYKISFNKDIRNGVDEF